MSIVALIFTLIIFLPNLLVIIKKPQNVPTNLKDFSVITTLIERLGQLLIFASIFISNSNTLNFNLYFFIMILFLAGYYLMWIRYLIKGNEFFILFKPLYVIPIPMAIFPICAFLFLGLLINSIYMIVSVIIFAIGHIVNSWFIYIKLRKD